MVIKQGDIYWVSLAGPDSSEPAIAHPQVVIQDDVLNRSRIPTLVVCALTTNAKRAKSPGNVRLEAGEANLPRPSVVVVSQVSTVAKAQLGAYIGSLTQARIAQILAGLRFVQSLTEHHDQD
ncbi:MAG: type II toxin-antitoxin system PemK/MazF family toxin [Anaerolineales bacterium]|nr:type II toxin-antitoxin system PemK/MazF family toxin [Anaerolineales bacterium]